MRKALLSILFASFVFGGSTSGPVNSNITNIADSQNSLSTNTTTIIKTEDSGTITAKAEPVKISAQPEPEKLSEKKGNEEDAGTAENPFQPPNLIHDENSLGNMKYYFVILVLSSLSVVSVIIFKALR